MLEINELHVSYGENRVIENLSLNLPLQQVHGLVGMNGAGKTTLLNTLAGFISQGSGTVKMHGKPIQMHDVAFMETETFFYSYITGREYLELFRVPAGAPDIAEWNGLFKLPLDQLVDTYSSGMKKKLALIGVLRQGKPLVILDEPFNGLDMESSRLLSLVISRLKEKGTTVILTSHILGALTGICDHIHLLRNGKISFSRERQQFSGLEEEIFREVDEGYVELVRGVV